MSKAQFSRIQVMLIKVVFDEEIITIVSTLRGLVPYLDVIDPGFSCYVDIYNILVVPNVLLYFHIVVTC